MVADELRRQADSFIELRDLQELIERDPRLPHGDPPIDGSEDDDDHQHDFAMGGGVR